MAEEGEERFALNKSALVLHEPGKSVVITGGSTGIGAALVQRLVQRKVDVYVLDVTGHGVAGGGVAVGGTGVSVGDGGAVGGTGVSVGGGVAVGGRGVSVGGTGVSVSVGLGEIVEVGVDASRTTEA